MKTSPRRDSTPSGPILPGAAWCAAVFLIAGALPVAHAQFTFTPLSDLSGGLFGSSAAGVSGDGGVVVGTGSIASGNSNPLASPYSYEAFRWTPEPVSRTGSGLVGLGDLGGGPNASQAFGVSGDGSVVVGVGVNGAFTEAFRWTEAGGMEGLGALANFGPYSEARAISADGSVIVGGSETREGFHAFRWTEAGGIQLLVHPAIWMLSPPGNPRPYGSFGSEAFSVSADGSVVVGAAAQREGERFSTEAFRWTAGGGGLFGSGVMVGLGDLPGGNFLSRATGVSANGSVVVGTGAIQNGQEAFRWTLAGGMVGLGDLSGGFFGSQAYGVSGDGSVVVGRSWSAAGAEAFFWDPVHGMQSIRDGLIASGVDMTGWILDTATAVSADGRAFVGFGTNPAGQQEAWLVRAAEGTSAPPGTIGAVPEPATYGLLAAIGLLGATTWRRIRRAGQPSDHR